MTDHLKMHSLNKIDENVSKIAQLFPNCVTEAKDENGEITHKIDFDMLKQELSHSLVEGREERYQFTWPDKKQAILTANAPINKTLRPCREKSINFDTTQNLYIEGDNLEALKILQETYLGKIKMIYIDPPYNTGNDFVYADNFTKDITDYIKNSGQIDENGNKLLANTESNGRFHTDWLNMIYPRLKLAKDLLADNGVIFISLDENEISNMKYVCNEIFGEGNLVTVLHVEMSATQGMKVKAAQNGNIVKNAEYILVYSRDGHKNIATTLLYDYRPVYDGHYSKMIIDEQLVNLKDIFLKEHPNEKISNITDSYTTNENFRLFIEKNIENIFADDKISGFDIKDYPVGKVYKLEGDGRNYYIYNNGTKIRQLLPLSASYGKCDDFDNSYGLRKIRGDWWKDFYRDMGNVSKEGDTVFANGKKPLRLIQQLCKMCTTSNDIILDFFSGSATTAHAVIRQNAEDELNRKFILVQLPENCEDNVDYEGTGFNNICDIGEERIRRSSKSIKDEYGEKTKNLDFGFRVLKIDSSNMEDVYYTPDHIDTNDLFKNNIKSDRTGEDLLFQTMLDLGIMLSSKIETKKINGKEVFCVEGNYLMACFDDSVDEKTITEIAKEKPYNFVMRDPANSKDGDSLITNFEQIFTTYSPETVRKIL